MEHNTCTRMFLKHEGVTFQGTSPKCEATGALTKQKQDLPLRGSQHIADHLQVSQTVLNAVVQMMSKFEHKPSVKMQDMATTLAMRVDKIRLLPEFSNTIKAAVCLRITTSLLGEGFVFSKDFAKRKLHLQPDAVQVAYNNMWLQRRQLRKVLQTYGEIIGRMKPPRNKYKEKDIDLISKDKGIATPLEFRKFRTRKERFGKSKSLLSLVTCADDDDFDMTTVDEEMVEGASSSQASSSASGRLSPAWEN